MQDSTELEIANAVAPEPAPSKPISLVEQYELGDDIAPTDDDIPVEAQPKAQKTPVEAETPARPRGPDGKFLPADAPKESPKIPARLTRQAEELGFSEDDLEGATKEQVEDWIFAANKAQAKARKAESLMEVRERKKPAEIEGDPSGNVASDDGLTEDMFSSDIIAEFRKRDARIAELEKMVGQLGKVEHSRQVESFASQFDAAVEKLEMPQMFGTGRGIEMDTDSLEFKRRVKMVEEVAKDKSDKPMRVKVEAAAALFGFSKSAPAPAKPAPPTNGHTDEITEADWRDATLARPTSRKATEPKGERKAVATAAEYMRRNGMVDEDDVTKDGFL